MVLPKNSLFSWTTADEARSRMTDYIRNHFADVLGEDVKLLDLPNGLELVQDRIRRRLAEHGIQLDRSQAAA